MRGPSPWHSIVELLFQRRVRGITVMKLPNTVPLPALEPATPAVAAPAPGNLAAVSESLEMALVWKLWLGISEMVWGPGAAKLLWLSWVSVSSPSPPLWTVITQQREEVLLIREEVETNLAQASIFRG